MKIETAIGLVGGGQMGEALIRGMLESGLTTAANIMVADPAKERITYLHESYGITVASDPAMLANRCPVLVLAVKPQMISSVAPELRLHLGADHLVISIMAGINLAALSDHLGAGVRLVRVMPNTPCLVLAGASVFAPGESTSAEDRALVSALFGSVGSCVELPEHLLDAVTGLSGSGPSYVFTFIEAMVDGGVLTGMPRSVAEQLVLQTVYGSAKLAMESGEPAAVLKGRVTSPGGTAIAGIRALEQGGLRGAVMEAVAAATRRSQELGAA